MSEIKKYQKAMNFKANPRYLTRDFIVPLYTGTEPDIVPETSVEQLETGRTNFSEGSKLTGTDKTLEQNIKDDHKAYNDYRKSIGQSTIPLDKAFIKMWQRTRLNKGGLVSISDFSRQQKSIGRQAFQKYLVPSQINTKGGKDLVNALSKSGIVFSDKKGPYGERYLKNVNKNTIKNFEKNIKNIREYVEVPSTIVKNNVVVGVRWPNKDVEKEYIDQIKKRSKYSKNSSELQAKVKSGEILNDSQLAKKFGMNYSEVVRINSQIKKDYNLERPVIGRDETRKQVDIKRKEAQLKFSEPGFEKKYSGTYKAHLGHMGDLYNRMVTSKNLGYTPAEINDAMKETLDPILKNISQAQDKLIKNKPPGWKQKLEEYNKKGINYSSLAEGYKSFDIIDPNTLEKYTYGVDYLKTIDPAALYKGKPIKEIAELTDKREINKIQKAFDDLTEAKKIARTEGLEQADISKIKNSELLTEENLKKLQDYNAFEQNKEAVMKAQSKVPVSEKRKVISNLTNYLNNNPEEVKAFRTAGVVCRRSAGGKVDVECLAENIIKETEKLETGTDLQKTSALNKFKNATKLGAGLAEEVVGFGTGVAGRTLTPLVALNSALEQWTSGDTKEGFRKIADVLDPTTLVGDPFGFGKSRMEGTQEDVKKIIGEKNYKGFENIKAAADEYNQYLETKKKFERAKSSAEGAYDPLSPGVDTAYLTDLEKQKNILEKNITGTKYGDVEDNLLNYGDLIYKNILKKFPDAPESSKYVYKKAAIEKLENAFGIDIIDLYRDDLNKKFGPDLNIIDIQQEKLKPLSEEQQNVIESSGAVGAAEGGRIGLSEGGGPKISRRGFLGFLAGAAAAPFVGKLMKGKKTAQVVKIGTKVLPKVADMPEWFPSLVARIEKEGIDISPKATSVEDIRTIKKIEVPVPGKEKPDIIKMTQYPNGAIHIEADVYGGSFDSPFDLHYRPPKSDIDLETGKQIVEPGEFSVIETRPRPVYDPHSADYELEYENMSVKDAISDLERVEKIATGKRIHPKRVEQREKARADVEDKPYEDIINRYGDRDIPDWWDPSDYASGGRVKFSGGGKVKFARMITDILGSLRQKLSFSSHLEKLYGTEKAKEKILSPYRLPEGTNKSQHSDILMYIDESRQNLPKEYNDLQNILNEIEKDISNYDYISADKKGRTLLDRLPESFNFEKLSQDLFPMEDPLNNAIILMDPQRNNMRGRFVNKVRINPETKRGTIETFDTFDTENKKWLSEDEWKLKGAESYEKGKEGLN